MCSILRLPQVSEAASSVSSQTCSLNLSSRRVSPQHLRVRTPLYTLADSLHSYSPPAPHSARQGRGAARRRVPLPRQGRAQGVRQRQRHHRPVPPREGPCGPDRPGRCYDRHGRHRQQGYGYTVTAPRPLPHPYTRTPRTAFTGQMRVLQTCPRCLVRNAFARSLRSLSCSPAHPHSLLPRRLAPIAPIVRRASTSVCSPFASAHPSAPSTFRRQPRRERHLGRVPRPVQGRRGG